MLFRSLFQGRDFTVEIALDGTQLNSVNILGNYQISGILKNHLTKRLLGGQPQLTPAQLGLMARQGISREFLNLIGGGKS